MNAQIKESHRALAYPLAEGPSKLINRENYSKSALTILDDYGVTDATDPVAIMVTILDRMQGEERQAIQHFESAIALASVEFGRIDLAISKADESQKRADSILRSVEKLQKDFTVTTNKIRERSYFDIVVNHLKPFIYVLIGALITLLVEFLTLRLKLT